MFVKKIIWHIKCVIKKIIFKILFFKKFKYGKHVNFRNGFNLIIDGGTVIINDGCFFNNFCSINCLKKVEIGKNCIFGECVKIYDHNHNFKDLKKLFKNQGFSSSEIIIGENCWVCSNVIILKGAKIGNNCVIGANCIIDFEVPDNSIVKLENKNMIIKEIEFYG